MPAAGLQLLWLVVALSQLPRSLCFTCSEGCKCIWRGGKMYGECPLLELSALPSGMDENLQVLNLTHNLIRALPKHAFVNAGLINVQRLYLSRCELSHIDDSALFKVTNLIELDLSDNKLSAVPTAALSSTPKLKSLNLNRNPITALADMAFSDLTELTHLEMTECRLESVAAGAFEGLSNLKVLKLDHNLLETLPGRAMAPFSLLHEIALDGNQWRCDCELRAFRMWLERNNISHYSPTCHKPLRLSSKPWKSLSSEDMACPPAFVNASSSTSEEVVVVHENSNVTLKCRARADPPAEISWLWKDKPLSNQSEPGQAFVLTQEPGDRERLSWLTLRFVQEPLAGLYACVAQNAAGRVVRNFTLEVTKRTTEGRPSAGGGVTAEVEMTEQARESTELQQRSYAENPVLGMVIGILVGALAVLVVFGLTLWLCRRRGRRRGAPLGSRKRTEANSNHKALHNDKQQQQSQPATDDAADVKLLVNPIQKPPRLLMTNSYHQGLPSELEPLDPGLCVESSSGVWVVKEHDYSTDESVLSSIPSRAGTIDRRSLARSPIPVPMPVVPPTDDLHARLHGELTDTLRRTKGDRRPLVERADAQSPLEPYAGLETLRVRDLEHRGPDLIDQIGAAQPPSPRWTPYEHPSAYYRATAGTPQSCYPPSIPEAPADGTEV